MLIRLVAIAIVAASFAACTATPTKDSRYVYGRARLIARTNAPTRAARVTRSRASRTGKAPRIRESPRGDPGPIERPPHIVDETRDDLDPRAAPVSPYAALMESGRAALLIVGDPQLLEPIPVSAVKALKKFPLAVGAGGVRDWWDLAAGVALDAATRRPLWLHVRVASGSTTDWRFPADANGRPADESLRAWLSARMGITAHDPLRAVDAFVPTLRARPGRGPLDLYVVATGERARRVSPQLAARVTAVAQRADLRVHVLLVGAQRRDGALIALAYDTGGTVRALPLKP